MPQPRDAAILTPPALALDATPRNVEDLPDRRDGEWSLKHLVQFLGRQEKTMVIIPLTADEMEKPDQAHFKEIGYMGHPFHLQKGVAQLVPVQIAEIINNSLDPFPTQQAKLRRREITDVRALPSDPNGRGALGVQIDVGR